MKIDRGFTLLELIIVVMIIGILAAIAIPRFASTKDKAYVSTMKTDLRNLVTTQEAYQADFVSYAPSTSLLTYQSSVGVTVTIGAATPTGWNATARHNATAKTCGIFIGDASPPIGGVQAGEAGCT